MFVFRLEPLMSWWRIAFNDILFHYSCIHMDSSVKNTLNFSYAKINKVLSKHCNLGIPMFRSACGLYLWYWGLVIVKVCDLARWPISFLKGDLDRDYSWWLSWWRCAL